MLTSHLSFVSALAVTSMRNPNSLDSFWHLKLGQSWVESGLVPWIDHFSFTYYGSEVIGTPYIYEVLLHGFVVLFGLEFGFIAFK